MIRKAERSDLPEIKKLALAAWRATYHGIMSDAEIVQENERFYVQHFHDMILDRCEKNLHLFNVLVEEGELIGLMDFDFNKKESWLMRFYLRPDCIGKGYGKKLMQQSENDLVALGRTNYYLMVHLRNELGRSYYDRNGFVRAPQRDQKQDEEVCYFREIPR